MDSPGLTSVFNIPEIEEEVPDYRKLYEKEKKKRQFFEKKTKDLQKKIKKQFHEQPNALNYSRTNQMQERMEDIKTFKSLLPNSVKYIPNSSQDLSINSNPAPPLIQQWAIFGLSERQMANAKENNKMTPSVLASNEKPTQLLEQSARLVFPSGTSATVYQGKTAQQISLDIINLSKQKLKTFILTFQPASVERQSDQNSQTDDKRFEIINKLNPERRPYAICLQIDEYSVIGEENQITQSKMSQKSKKTMKSVKFRQPASTRDAKQFQVAVSKRIYVIFTSYPFFAFFQELLKSLLFAVKVDRYIKYKQGGEKLGLVDSRFHCYLLKKALSRLADESLEKAIVADKLLDFSLCGNNKAYLQLNREALTFNMAEQWAYYILSLFTLDVFLDLLTLITLEEKIVFVCSNATILTHAIYLFTKVLTKPFEYPYPVVYLLPDQEEYLNAPFPVVYGYLKSRQQIEQAKYPKKYKNVYVFFEPEGVQIESQDDKTKLLNKKSPKLRDRLISKFKKMQKNFPSSSFFNFIKKKPTDFEFPVNIPLARQIISEVSYFFQNDVYKLLPNDNEVNDIRTSLKNLQTIEEEDLNKEVFEEIRRIYGPKSKDPFFSAFLDTQLLNVHIFKY